MSVTPKEHLKHCIERAIEYMHVGKTSAAVERFMSEITHHEGTAWIAKHGATPALILATSHNPEEFRKAMETFDV